MSDEQVFERWLSLVQTLYKRTVMGKVKWQISPDFDQGFQAGFGEVRVVIQEKLDPDDTENPDFTLSVVKDPPPVTFGALGAIGTIINPESMKPQVIEEISNTSLRPVMDRTTEEGMNPYVLLRETFKLARRKAFGVDTVLDGLLEKLNEE